jgi:Nickel responsive protein SCO4226-like
VTVSATRAHRANRPTRLEEPLMPLFMDVHSLAGGVSVDDVAKAHMADLQTQGRFDVQYLRYWVNEADGKIFCLVDAPDADAANTVHREAHGLVADEIYPVQEGA